MKRTQSLKQRLIASVLVLVMLVSALLGTTFAWFTDSVSSEGNKIQAGNLKIDLLHQIENDWISVKEHPDHKVFDYDKWEPGYTRIETLKIANLGSLALKYQLAIEVADDTAILGENGESLADVIDVYVIYGDRAENNYTDIVAGTTWIYKGTLAEVLQAPSSFIGGQLLPTGEVMNDASTSTTAVGSQIVQVALHMQENAGNKYQKLSVGDIYVNLVATQWDNERDSFGNDYDKDATFPPLNISGITVDVKTENNVVTEDATVSGTGIMATIPAGVVVENGMNKLGLSVTEKAQSDANLTLNDGEALRSLDVHMAGVSKNNTVPMLITIEQAMKVGLNIGNYTLYHVENGASNAMTAVNSLEKLDAHNEFYYDPTTGNVTLAMATFSEVAMVAETENAWEGKFDYTWYDASKTELTIANADQLAAFGAIVGGMAEGIEQDSFGGKTVKLVSDINLGDPEEENNPDVIFYPIGYNSSDGKYEKTGVAVTTGFYNFCGTFDGNGNTVSNFYHNTWEMKGDNEYYAASEQRYRDGMGLFGRVYGGTVKNLTVKNFSSDGEYTTTGVIAAYADGATFENIAIFNCNPRVYNIGNGGIVGCVGWYAKEANLETTFKNITVDNSNKISALWGSYDVACGGIVGQYYPTSGQSSAGKPANGGVSFENCHISAQMDVYNDVCGNYQYYAYRYAGMLIGSVRENVTIDGHVYPKMDGITANDCTVHFGTWNDYYYCEFEKNGHPSYSGPDDYKFSRIPHSEINFTDSNGNGIIDTEAERASVTGCKHEHTAAENNQAIRLPFNNLVTGYGWGVTTKVVGELVGVTILDREVADSVDKFEGKVTELANNKPYKLGDIFKFVDNGVELIPGALTVSIANKDKNNPVSATIDYDRENWENGNITLTGTGEITITIQDYYFCTPTTITVNVTDRQPEEKFDVVMNNGDFLHRVGNSGTVALDKLFKAKDGVTVGTVSVTVEAVNGAGASGTYSNNAIQFNGTGVVKVTITDNDYCTPTELYLEVVEATNVTGLSGTISSNVVLLNDCGLSSLTVSGRNTVFGNGFTATYTGNGQYLNNGLKQGVVTVSENGTIDNLRIKASIYPTAFMYYGSSQVGDYVQQSSNPRDVEGDKTRYYYQLSAVAASGNATIQNCYIYGGRTNVFVNTGNVTIKDTILECGVVANVQIQSNASHTITLEDVTTIQYQVNATVGDTSKVMLGTGVLVGPDTTENPTIVLNGEFKQYNWVTAEDADSVSSSVAQMIINGALDATAYNHTVNSNTASNLGIIYMNTVDAKVTNNTGLPYKLGTVSMKASGMTVNGQVYSLQGATAEQIYSDYVNADRTTINGLYQPQFKFDDDLGGQYIEKDSGDEHFYREGDIIHVLFPSGDSKEIDLATLVNISKYVGQDLGLVITVKDSIGNAVEVTNGKITLSAADTYTVTYTVIDTLFYDKDGNAVSNSVEYSWNVTIEVSLKDTAIPDAYYQFDTSKQKMGYYKPSWGDVKQYIPFLAGLKIYDYNGQDAYLRFDGDKDYNKIASITVTNKYSGNDALVVVNLTDGGTITLQLLARADSGGGSTYTGSIKTSNNVIYFVNDGGTSSSDKTTTAAYWYVDYYKFIGNNGVEITSGQQTFNSTGSSASTPSGNFSTTIKSTVTFDANGGNCGQTIGYATSAATAVTLPTPTRSGYIFAGWYTAANGGTRVGGAGDSYTPSANITLYAQWGKPCTVTYDANGGSCGTASEKYTGTALTLPTPTRDGYWFVGWYDAAEGGNKIGDKGAKYNPGNEITLYAHWQEAIKYTVTYNANGGLCGTDSATYEGTALTLPTPTRTGYTFNGWYTAASGGTKIGDAGATYVPSANITLYAQWTIKSYQITVSTSNGSVSGVTNGQFIAYDTSVSVTVSFDKSNSKTFTVKNDTTGETILSKSNAGTYTFKMPDSNVTINVSSSGCFAEGTLITLADGTQKRIEEITFEDQLLAWDFNTGTYVATVPSLIDRYELSQQNVINLKFADGTVVRMVVDHGFFDVAANKFIFLNEENVASYVGHTFVKMGENGTYENVELVGYEITVEDVAYYSIQTAIYNNCIAEGMFTLTAPPEMLGYNGWFDYFEIGDGMKYDEEKMQADIEKYGLYTYEDFAEYVTYEQFIAFNGPYLKVLVGRGIVTYEQIIELINMYVNPAQ